MPPTDTTAPDPAVSYALARVEAKIDVVLAQHEAKIEQHDEGLQDHEGRLRILERTPSVSPRTLWATVSSGVIVMAAIGPILARLYS